MPHDDIAERLGSALRDRGETIAVAESCTGGLLGSLITGVPGASDYFVGGVISYTDRTKRQFLAIERELLDSHGAVSAPVARAMAQHVRDEANADWAVSTTGYAGAAEDDAAEPAGTVYVGVASASPAADGPFAIVERHQYDGTRQEATERIARQALATALEQIRNVG